MGVRVGEPGPTNYTGDVDKFVIGIVTGTNTDTKTYDFEPTAAVVTTCDEDQHLVDNQCVPNTPPACLIEGQELISNGSFENGVDAGSFVTVNSWRQHKYQ